MPKLAKNRYKTLKGEIKINTYLVHIPKKVVYESDINDNDNLKIYTKDGKIIIEKDNSK